MSYRFRGGLIIVAMVGVSCLAGAFVQSAPTRPYSEKLETLPPVISATKQDQSYIGSDRCATCHRKQVGTWSETNHALAFDHLPEKYRNDSSCLKCHVTAFGEPSGYDPGMSATEAEPFLHVGCESCHGPGALHEEAVKLWTLADPADEEKLEKEIKATIVRTPTDSQCADCHLAQSHGQHPPYDGQLVNNHSSWHAATATISSPPSPHSYSVKTCASCHYEEYKTWRIDKHVGLSAKIPAKYETDQNCLACHRKGQDSSEWKTPTTNPESVVHQVGVGCESCHGSGFNHVLFNKQYIGNLPLGPELELAARQSIRQETPATSCVQCHIRERHQEHSEFEKAEVEVSK